MNDIEKPEDFDIFDELVTSLDFDKELALKFFLVFSWFENILKNLKFFKNRGFVSIDWVRFGNELNDQFNSDRTPELQKAISFLLEETPKNQRIESDAVKWQRIFPPEEANTKLGKILFWVTTVRNNFFHGGKIPEFRERDAKLLRCCLVILDECVHLQGDFRAVYDRQIRGEK